jgi:hypothetical protein
LELYYGILLLSDNGENLKNKQEQHFTFVRMGNLPTLLPNATPLVSKFFSKNVKETSVLKQGCQP